MIRPAAASLCLFLAGCMAVPLSTIVRMSTFDEKDFVRLDPDVMRVRIKLPDAFILDPARSALEVSISAKAGVHSGAFALEQEGVDTVTLSRGVFVPDRSGAAYTLKLTPDSKAAFRKLQDFVSQGPTGGTVITVKPVLSAYPDSAETVDVWIDLLLADDEGYFTLLEGAEVPMERIRAASARR